MKIRSWFNTGFHKHVVTATTAAAALIRGNALIGFYTTNRRESMHLPILSPTQSHICASLKTAAFHIFLVGYTDHPMIAVLMKCCSNVLKLKETLLGMRLWKCADPELQWPTRVTPEMPMLNQATTPVVCKLTLAWTCSHWHKPTRRGSDITGEICNNYRICEYQRHFAAVDIDVKELSFVSVFSRQLSTICKHKWGILQRLSCSYFWPIQAGFKHQFSVGDMRFSSHQIQVITKFKRQVFLCALQALTSCKTCDVLCQCLMHYSERRLHLSVPVHLREIPVRLLHFWEKITFYSNWISGTPNLINLK